MVTEVGIRVVSLTVCLPHSQRCELKLHHAERTVPSLRKESPRCRARLWIKSSRCRPLGPQRRHQLETALPRRTPSQWFRARAPLRQPDTAMRKPPQVPTAGQPLQSSTPTHPWESTAFASLNRQPWRQSASASLNRQPWSQSRPFGHHLSSGSPLCVCVCIRQSWTVRLDGQTVNPD